MKKLTTLISRIWYGSVGREWWRLTDELCGKNAPIWQREIAAQEIT